MQNKVNKIKVVLFDADGVLFDNTGIHDGVVKELLDTLDLSKMLDAEIVHQEWDLEDEKLQSESLTPVTFLSPPETLARSLIKVFERRDIFLSSHYAKEFAVRTIERFCTHSRLFPDTKGILPILRKKYALGIISNMAVEATIRKLENTGIGTFFRHIIGPDIVKAYKPSPKIFLHALTLFAVAPDNVVFIGDNHKTDIIGGIKAGITTILLDRKQQIPQELNPLPDFRITNLTELPELLSSLSIAKSGKSTQKQLSK